MTEDFPDFKPMPYELGGFPAVPGDEPIRRCWFQNEDGRYTVFASTDTKVFAMRGPPYMLWYEITPDFDEVRGFS